MEMKELVAAIKANNTNVIELAPKDEDGDYDTNPPDKFVPLICGWTKFSEGPEDWYVVRVELEESEYGDYVTIYGIAKDGWNEPMPITVEHGHMEYIIDAIPETNEVKNVSMKFNPEDIFKDC